MLLLLSPRSSWLACESAGGRRERDSGVTDGETRYERVKPVLKLPRREILTKIGKRSESQNNFAAPALTDQVFGVGYCGMYKTFPGSIGRFFAAHIRCTSHCCALDFLTGH